MIDLKDKVFGRLTVISTVDKNKHGSIIWLCHCSCGNEHKVASRVLIGGLTKSCGCFKKDNNIGLRTTTHGQSKTLIYGVWNTMNMRCNNPAVKSYPRYGGRGIKVCERWRLFENFLADMGLPESGMTLDRKDTNGNYSPENCLWATKLAQARNKSNNRWLSDGKETLLLEDWARRLNCTNTAIIKRLQSGWSEKDAVTIPIPQRPNGKLTNEQALWVIANHPAMSAPKLGAIVGVSATSIRNILNGKTFKDLKK